jgi:hypothetical protein
MPRPLVVLCQPLAYHRVLHCTMSAVGTRANPHEITRINDVKELVRSWVLSLRRLKSVEIRE